MAPTSRRTAPMSDTSELSTLDLSSQAIDPRFFRATSSNGLSSAVDMSSQAMDPRLFELPSPSRPPPTPCPLPRRSGLRSRVPPRAQPLPSTVSDIYDERGEQSELEVERDRQELVDEQEEQGEPMDMQEEIEDRTLPLDRGQEPEALIDNSAEERPEMVQAKLHRFVVLLRECGWSFQRFLRVWAGESKGGIRLELDHRRYRTAKMRRKLLLSHPLLVNDIREDYTKTILRELQRLPKSDPVFGKFDATVNLEDINYNSGIAAVKRRAPTWCDLMIRLLRNQRAHRQTYGARVEDNSDVLDERIFWLASFICHSRMRASSNNMTAHITASLMNAGVKRRTLTLLSGFGVTYGYERALEIQGEVAKHAKETLRSLAYDPQVVVNYDNINIPDTKRDEVLGHKSSATVPYTTAVLVKCPDLPRSGLTQDMHDPTNPLELEDILSSLGISGNDGGFGVAMSTALIADAIQSIHRDSLEAVFKNWADFPTMPLKAPLPARRTAFWQFGAIYEDEGQIEGHYGVHDNIFLRQLGLKASEDGRQSDDFSNRLWLVHGDQLTSQRIRSVKAEQARATRAYDRRDWILGLPSWFHIQMNLLFVVVRTHWEPEEKGCTTRHCLLSDIVMWDRSCTGVKTLKYHQIEPVVRDGFAARVCALFYTAMRRRGLLAANALDGPDAQEVASLIVSQLTPEQFHELVEDVRIAAFTLSAWRDGTDVEYRSMCRLLQEVEMFLIVRHAVKHGDIELLRYMVDPLVVMFSGFSRSNYGPEMLYYRWNLLDRINKPELQHAILASGLVNWRGLPNSFKPIDLGGEQLNGAIKIELKCYKNSTHDVDTALNRVCLSNTWNRALREKLEMRFGEKTSGKHAVASTVMDCFVLARKLFADRLVERHIGATGRGKLFDSKDVWTDGMELLGPRIDAFNMRVVREPSRVGVATFDELEADADGFMDIEDIEQLADIRAYIDALEEES